MGSFRSPFLLDGRALDGTVFVPKDRKAAAATLQPGPFAPARFFVTAKNFHSGPMHLIGTGIVTARYRLFLPQSGTSVGADVYAAILP
jgi:hypothetical protein